MTTGESYQHLIAVGYLLIRPVSRPPWSSEVLPDRILSVSRCICPQFPGAYALEWSSLSDEGRANGFDAMGLAQSRRKKAMESVTASFGESIGWNGVFLEQTAARQAARDFFGSDEDVYLVGLGLRRRDCDLLCETGYPESESGYCTMARRRHRLAEGGEVIGYEPCNAELGSPGCSWLCNGLEADLPEQLGIAVNSRGLISALDDCVRLCAMIDSDKIGAEPGPWLSWGMVVYTI